MTDSARRQPRQGWIYFVSDGTAIKIGWSPKPAERCKSLATGNPRPLVVLAQIPGTLRDEKLLQRLLKPYQVRSEWFHARKPVLALVDWAKRHGDQPDALDERVALLDKLHERKAEIREIETKVGSVANDLHADYRMVKQAIRAHLAELERAVDQADSQKSLGDAVRDAALVLATICHAPGLRHLDAIFDGIGSLWYLAGEVEEADEDAEADAGEGE